MKKRLPLFFFLLAFIQYVPAQQFHISYSDSLFKGPFTGHVILYLSKDKQNPKREIDIPCYGVVVENIQPLQAISVSANAVFYPAPLTKLDRGDYYVQAVWDRNLGGRNIGTSPGNLYSQSQKITLTADTSEQFTLFCNRIVPEPGFVETTFVKELKAPSKLLSDFHHRPMTVNGVVILPKEYYNTPGRNYPVLFVVGGYGLEYHHYSASASTDTLPGSPVDTMEVVRVFLDGNCQLGHSCYANSDNNGPWGDALTQEFIPLLEKRFRCNGAILMKGHSSGGWTVLWLQTHYPRLFAGCTASAPDYVDFRSFGKTNLYADSQNQVQHEKAQRKPHVEDVLYRGEQHVSFDAVFSPRGPNGMPISLYDTTKGKINNSILNHWRQYDLSLYIYNNWNTLKNDLDGKIRISVGNQDTYNLNFSVEKMEEKMKELNTKFVFAYYPGDHWTVNTPEYKKDENGWLEQKYLDWRHITGR